MTTIDKIRLLAIELKGGVSPMTIGTIASGTAANIQEWSHPLIVAAGVSLCFQLVFSTIRLARAMNKDRHAERIELLNRMDSLRREQREFYEDKIKEMKESKETLRTEMRAYYQRQLSADQRK